MGGCLQKYNIEGGDYLKRGGGLGLFADLRWWCGGGGGGGGLGKKERVMFLRGRGETQCTRCYNSLVRYT